MSDSPKLELVQGRRLQVGRQGTRFKSSLRVAVARSSPSKGRDCEDPSLCGRFLTKPNRELPRKCSFLTFPAASSPTIRMRASSVPERALERLLNRLCGERKGAKADHNNTRFRLESPNPAPWHQFHPQTLRPKSFRSSHAEHGSHGCRTTGFCGVQASAVVLILGSQAGC